MDHDFDHDAVALSAGVRKMVRSDIGASGVRFTRDTEPGFDDDMTHLTLGLNRGPPPWLRPSSVDVSPYRPRPGQARPRGAVHARARHQGFRKADKYVGTCGRALVHHPDVTELPLEQGIESRSLNPDTVGYIGLTLAPVQTMHQFRNQGGT